MAIRNPSLRLVIDSSAVAISILVIQYGFAYISFDKQVNLERIVSDSIVAFLVYFVSLCIFTKVGGHTWFLPTLYSVALGSFLWITYKMVLFVQTDWDYISDHPEALYDRHVTSAALAFGILVPLFAFISLGFILLARLLTGSKPDADGQHFD